MTYQSVSAIERHLSTTDPGGELETFRYVAMRSASSRNQAAALLLTRAPPGNGLISNVSNGGHATPAVWPESQPATQRSRLNLNLLLLLLPRIYYRHLFELCRDGDYRHRRRFS